MLPPSNSHVPYHHLLLKRYLFFLFLHSFLHRVSVSRPPTVNYVWSMEKKQVCPKIWQRCRKYPSFVWNVRYCGEILLGVGKIRRVRRKYLLETSVTQQLWSCITSNRARKFPQILLTVYPPNQKAKSYWFSNRNNLWRRHFAFRSKVPPPFLRTVHFF